MKIHLHHGLALAAVFAVSCALGDEIHSNGLGSGLWSDPNSWNGKKVPTATDVVVIAAKDVVLFDRDDSGKNTCKEIHIDPNGTLAFQRNSGSRILCVDGIIESYGIFKIDASNSKDNMELRMVAAAPEQRVIRLLKGSALIVTGNEELADDKHNATLIAWPVGDAKTLVPGKITGGQHVAIDIKYTDLQHMVLEASSIDNTGSKPNERLNVVGNRFTGLSSMVFTSCDTPLVKGNLFLASTNAAVAVSAMYLNACPLAEIRGNKVVGPYPYGIQVNGECSVNGNIIEKCTVGLYWYVYNAMARQNVIRDCETGIYLANVTGTFEDIEIDKCKFGISANATIAQLTNIGIKNVDPKGGHALTLDSSSLTILNCNLKPDQIHCTKTPNPQVDLPWIDSMQFLVVKANGTVPPKTQVEVATVQTGKPLAEGVADLNVRNSPAMIRPSGLTALPPSPSCLVIRAWKIERDGKTTPTPDYTLSIWTPAEKQGDKNKVLFNKKIKPDESWYRPIPNDPNQAMEVTLP